MPVTLRPRPLMHFLGTDPQHFGFSQSYADSVGVKKLLTTVPVRKPHSQEFVRAHARELRLPGAAVIELKDDESRSWSYPQWLPRCHRATSR